MSKRIYSIDSFRAIGMVFIVMIHTHPFEGLGYSWNALNLVIRSVAGFAVPLFFVISGILFAQKYERGSSWKYLKQYISKVASIYLFGMLLYLPITLMRSAATAYVSGSSVPAAVVSRFYSTLSPLGLVYYGDSVSPIFWFLPALIFSVVLLFVFLELGAGKWTFTAAAAFHSVGLLTTTYGLFDLRLNTTDALFYGFFYVSLGFFLKRWELPSSRKHSNKFLFATVASAILLVVEQYTLNYLWTGQSLTGGTNVAKYTVGTFLLVFSVSMFVLSRPTLGQGTRLPELGTLSVGIYVVHPSILYSLTALSEFAKMSGVNIEQTIIWHLLLTPVVFLGALGIYVVFDKLDIIDSGGSHIPFRAWFST
ncbi:acyltransferase [Haloferax sp. Atlit-4N]|uniref:acyltransferase n=1 Tax=Haloferax sp. Atlit-4N TaxID=2077206 RepID=UPI000E227C56|nr:acyltransferase [Haloferax sp. Atlit-4N]RDZ52718.1 acyltransferase [Haloferax sp. Atlit-4N]